MTMTGTGLPIALIGVLMALWLVGAIVAIWIGLSLRNESRKMLSQTSRLRRLLETAPAFPVVVKSDGRLEAPDRFSRLLGLMTPATTLSDLGGHDEAGLAIDDMAALDAKVRETQRTGKSFVLALAIKGSERRLTVVGNIADVAIYPNGAALLWFFDSTDSLRELEKRTQESEEARTAFAALAGLIEAAPLPMWHRRPDMRLHFVNHAYVDAVGATDGLQVVKEGIELLEPEKGKSPADWAAEAMAADAQRERIVSATLNGERRQLRVFDIPLGQSGVAGLAIDVQDLIDAKSEVRELSEAQRDLLNLMSAGVAQFDARHVLTFANLPFQSLFTFRDQWLSEKPEFARVLDRMRENGKVPEVRDFPTWRREREDWFRTSDPNEENWLLPDGTHLRVLAQPIPDGGLLMIFEDRTEQAQLASARDILLRVRSATFDNLFEAIAVFSADGRLSIWNRLFAETWGLNDDLLLEHPRLDELLPWMAQLLSKPSQITTLGELIRMTSSSREQRKSKAVFADGRMFQIATVPLPDGNALFTMLDMSNNLKIEQALRDRNSALQEVDAIKGKFLANMSYEFRTPLTSISGFADLLKEGIAGDLSDQAKEYVDAILQSADRLSDQINTVLDYSQIEAGALPLALEHTDVPTLVAQIADSKAAMAQAAEVELQVDAGNGTGEMALDPKRIMQAVGQALDNAIRYNKSGGQVLMLARWQGDALEFVVSDNGPGMREADVQRISSDNAVPKNADSNGSMTQGLGLPLARQIIESHGGTFHLHSAPGEGTVVIMVLPRP
ncbi:signal transduction histidine kinase [Sphingorhabdus rigui]|uniref:histidine kinase n=1 Tax=Sphingorhabdus rigui TaxID=1282858 RepID=A0A840AZ89_9SPHN|nr:PAS domain-containing sensor histidine kinase [Sphingorhabdus rigui]MBB3942933.1 signal transduction histidine kinase [Sphingorhabdus rigui]